MNAKGSNPRILIVTPEVTYLPDRMGSLANYLTAKAGGLADVSAALIDPGVNGIGHVGKGNDDHEAQDAGQHCQQPPVVDTFFLAGDLNAAGHPGYAAFRCRILVYVRRGPL